MIATVPVNFIDIAPILTRISALTASGLVCSITLPPWTQGTSFSRSRIESQDSSIGLGVVNGWSSSTTFGLPFVGMFCGQTVDVEMMNVDRAGQVRAGTRERGASDPNRPPWRRGEGRPRSADRSGELEGNDRRLRAAGRDADVAERRREVDAGDRGHRRDDDAR